MSERLSARACAVLQAIVAFKQAHDGNSPSMKELAKAVGKAKSSVWQAVQELETADLLQREPGSSRTLQLTGSAWRWVAPQSYPNGRVGDVLRVIVVHKAAHDGNAPGHREIATALGVVYSGAIKVYLDELVEAGFITTAYATDRYICVRGGQWTCDAAWLAAACGM